jgi:acetolactate synthase I/II/III large subunit
VLAFTGGRDPLTKYLGVYQEVDDLPAFENITKYNASVDDVRRFPDMLRQAFRAATTGTPGPVHLQFRGNEGQIDTEEAAMRADCQLQFRSAPAFRPAPDDDSVHRALHQLENAERPVIVAGGGASVSGASADLIALAEALAIPVATSQNGRDVIPATHPLAVGVVGTYSRACANQVVASADVVCFIGSSAGSMTTNFWVIPAPDVPVVQIDIEPKVIGRNYAHTTSVNGDARTAVRRMLELSHKSSAERRTAWIDNVVALREQWYASNNDVLTSDAVPIRPERICAELSKNLPDDACVLVDTGHASMWMSSFFDLRGEQQSYLHSCGHLGWAFPAGIGAKAALPDRPVVVFTGDAGIYYHLAEIETAVRWNLNSVTVVNNNGAGNQSRRGFDRAYGGELTPRSRELWTFEDVDLAKVAGDLGAVGIRVDRPAQLASALDQALTETRPVVIDVHTDVEVLPPPP